MKKILFTLGTITTIATPIALTISCSAKEPIDEDYLSQSSTGLPFDLIPRPKNSKGVYMTKEEAALDGLFPLGERIAKKLVDDEGNHTEDRKWVAGNISVGEYWAYIDITKEFALEEANYLFRDYLNTIDDWYWVNDPKDGWYVKSPKVIYTFGDSTASRNTFFSGKLNKQGKVNVVFF